MTQEEKMNAERTGILRWTGHPLVDVGIAALTIFAGKHEPQEVSASDLIKFMKFAEQHYVSGDLSKTVDVLFTRNSFLNPSFKIEQKRARIREAILAFAQQAEEGSPPCVYCGRPGLQVLHRDDIPMISGRGVPNFYPGGRPGLVICGICRTALHGLTLGAPRCSGRALIVQAADPRFVLKLIRPWVNNTVRFAQLSQAADRAPDIKAPQTRLIEALVQAEQDMGSEDISGGLVAYHLSNSGQGPGIQIYQLPSAVIRFLRRARSARTARAWNEIERRAWEEVKRGTTAADVSDDERLQYRNYLYEDLFRLPEEARRFLRIYFLRNAAGLVRSTDPRTNYSITRETHLVSWDLTVLFLEEVLNMEKRRIEAIRELADALAEEIQAENDRRLFRNLYGVRNDYRQARRLLLGANFRRLQRNATPILTFDGYLEVFEEGEELVRIDWRLAWDLMLIRLIEQLYNKGWFSQNQEVLNEVASEEPQEISEPVETGT